MRDVIILNQLPNISDPLTIWIGWDREDDTYYAAVLGPNTEEGTEVILWEGSKERRHATPTVLIQALREYAIIPNDLEQQLLCDDDIIDFYDQDEATVLIPSDLLETMIDGLHRSRGSC
jgi:hypothetical protein